MSQHHFTQLFQSIARNPLLALSVIANPPHPRPFVWMSKHRWIQPELRKVLTKLKMDDNQELRDGQDLLANMGLEVGIQVFLKLVELDCKRLYSTWDCPKNNFLHMQKILCAGLFVAWYIFMKREVTLMLALGTCIVNLLERGVAKPFALAIPPNGITAVLFLILKMIISKTS